MIYSIFEGWDHMKNIPLYMVEGRNNDYVGEWHHKRSEAQAELHALLN